MAETDTERLAREALEQRDREAAEARRRQAEAARTAALDKYEADHADVHAAAIAVLNIKVLVPIVLDRVANNYTRWRALFLVVLGKYALTDHVLTDVVNDDRPAWLQMNCTVLTWIYGTINPDLQQSTMLKEPNARVAWVHLEDEFLGQRESRALLLSAEFRTVKQGSSSITDFCRRLETMAASLREFGDPVGDRTLVLTLLRGLSEKFRPMVTNIKLRQPFPSFSEARTLLLLEEIDINDFAGDAGRGRTGAPCGHGLHQHRMAPPCRRPCSSWPQPGRRAHRPRQRQPWRPLRTPSRTQQAAAAGRAAAAAGAARAAPAPAGAVPALGVLGTAAGRSGADVQAACCRVHGRTTAAAGAARLPGRSTRLRRATRLRRTIRLRLRGARPPRRPAAAIAAAAVDAHASGQPRHVLARQQLQHHDALPSRHGRMVC